MKKENKKYAIGALITWESSGLLAMLLLFAGCFISIKVQENLFANILSGVFIFMGLFILAGITFNAIHSIITKKKND
ncbi:MAG: hypothetical protein ABIP51_01125 [Bacteroidia bacterium]